MKAKKKKEKSVRPCFKSNPANQNKADYYFCNSAQTPSCLMFVNVSLYIRNYNVRYTVHLPCMYKATRHPLVYFINQFFRVSKHKSSLNKNKLRGSSHGNNNMGYRDTQN